jgi:hypothetical protein
MRQYYYNVYKLARRKSCTKSSRCGQIALLRDDEVSQVLVPDGWSLPDCIQNSVQSVIASPQASINPHVHLAFHPQGYCSFQVMSLRYGTSPHSRFSHLLKPLQASSLTRSLPTPTTTSGRTHSQMESRLAASLLLPNWHSYHPVPVRPAIGLR